MEPFENITRITKDGYAAILRTKQRQQHIFFYAIGILFVVPMLQRIVYYIMLVHIKGGTSYNLSVQDTIFFLLFVFGLLLWIFPEHKIKKYIQQNRSKLDLQTVNQYIFFQDEILMMSTSSMKKFHLIYDDLTCIRNSRQWIVLYFENQNFTMLIDRNGFKHGKPEQFLTFIKKKMEGF